MRWANAFALVSVYGPAEIVSESKVTAEKALLGPNGDEVVNEAVTMSLELNGGWYPELGIGVVRGLPVYVQV